MRRLLLALAILSFSSGARAAAADIRLDPATGIPEAVTASDVLRDPTGRWTLDDVIGRAAAFGPAASLVPNVRAWVLAPSTLWFRLRPRAESAGPWYVHTTFEADRGEMFFVARDGRVERTRFGMLVPYNQRQLPLYTSAFRLPAKATREGTLYLRIVTREDVFGGYSIRPASWEAIEGRELGENRLLPELFITGMIFALALFNALLGLTLRERIYYWYAAATGSFAVFQCIESGAAWRWLWPNASIAYDVGVYAAYLTYFAFVLIFARDFLALPATQRSLWRAIVAIYGVAAVADTIYALAPNLVDRSNLSGVLDAIASGLLLGAIFCSGAIAWRRGYPGAGPYTVAFAGVFAGVIVGALGNNQLIAESGWTDAAPGIGVAWEAVFLALALTERIRRLRGERDALKIEALVDALTGIPNRRAFDRRIGDEWRLALRGQTPLAIIILDIDLFKSYNDTYGHQGGDLALTSVARVIARSLRRVDDFAARYGGEEFVVILPYCDVAGALKVADAICAAVASLGIVHRKNPSARLTLSAGAASIVPSGAATAEQLIAAADRALYEAKGAGRNRVAVSAA